MSAPFLMTALALVQSAWVVEELPLAPAPMEVRTASFASEEWLAVVAEAPDAGFGVFAVSPTLGTRTLLQTKTELRELRSSGTGVTISLAVDGGSELERLKLTGPAPELIGLGRFSRADFVTCDDEVRSCVIGTDEPLPVLWRQGERTPLWVPPPAAAESNDDWAFNFPNELEISGAALRPSGGLVAVAMASSAGVLELTTGRFVVVREKFQLAAPNIKAMAKTLGTPAMRKKLQSSFSCRSFPTGWNGNRVVIGTAGAEIGAEECADEFELDPKTLARSKLPSYPWKVLDCPNGGWTSQAGTFVTDCVDHVTRMMRGTRPKPPKNEQPGVEEDAPIGELPEAMALSETQIFVMAPKGKSTWRWYRGAAKGKGLEFVLHGPSVLTFGKKGVTVEALAGWTYGEAIFEGSLVDDWHLVNEPNGRPHLLRIRDDAQAR
ncbi:MAG: hypothetical protein QM817_01620 [Archangium sp.]